MRTTTLTLLLAVAPAAAFADACETVKAAFDRLAAAPSVHQTISMPGQAPMQMVVVGGAMYVDPGEGAWMTIPVDPAMRRQMMAQTIPDAAALKDCRETGTEDLGGIATTIYAYLPPSMAGEAPEPQQVWIGAADGLPRRMTTTVEGEPMEMTIVYEGVTAPAP